MQRTTSWIQIERNNSNLKEFWLYSIEFDLTCHVNLFKCTLWNFLWNSSPDIIRRRKRRMMMFRSIWSVFGFVWCQHLSEDSSNNFINLLKEALHCIALHDYVMHFGLVHLSLNFVCTRKTLERCVKVCLCVLHRSTPDRTSFDWTVPLIASIHFTSIACKYLNND